MDIWKILAGTAIGVGAVAAAPFTGGGSLLGGATLLGSLAGAGTIAAAVGMGAAGAAAGAYMNDDDDLREEGRRQGKKESDAEYLIKMKRITDSLQELQISHIETNKYFQGIIAMAAVAFAVAHCDGDFCEEEKIQIDEFLHGVNAGSNYPVKIKSRLQELADKKVTFNEAYLLARESGISLDIFDDIIYVTAHADGICHKNEQAFMDAWAALKAA